MTESSCAVPYTSFVLHKADTNNGFGEMYYFEGPRLKLRFPIFKYGVHNYSIGRNILLIPAAVDLAAELQQCESNAFNQLQVQYNLQGVIMKSKFTGKIVRLKLSPTCRGNKQLLNGGRIPPLSCNNNKIYITVDVYGIFVTNDNYAKLQVVISEWEN
jgi:hypothetical protein